MYMLDTNIIIYAIRHPESLLHDMLKQHIGKDLCISAITYGELEYGIQKSSRPEQNRLAVRRFLAGIRILSLDAAAAEHFGDILAELEARHERIGNRDTLIAAHARSLGCPVVTHNTREFCRVPGLRTEDWLAAILVSNDSKSEE